MNALIVTLRGQEIEIVDPAIWEDRSVGIPLHIDGFELHNADGDVIVWDLTAAETEIVVAAIWKQFDAERAMDWEAYAQDIEESAEDYEPSPYDGTYSED